MIKQKSKDCPTGIKCILLNVWLLSLFSHTLRLFLCGYMGALQTYIKIDIASYGDKYEQQDHVCFSEIFKVAQSSF